LKSKVQSQSAFFQPQFGFWQQKGNLARRFCEANNKTGSTFRFFSAVLDT